MGATRCTSKSCLSKALLFPDTRCIAKLPVLEWQVLSSVKGKNAIGSAMLMLLGAWIFNVFQQSCKTLLVCFLGMLRNTQVGVEFGMEWI